MTSSLPARIWTTVSVLIQGIITLANFRASSSSFQAALPAKTHPSYPFGRPMHLSHPATTSSTRVSLSRMRGRNGVGVQDLLGRLGLGEW